MKRKNATRTVKKDSASGINQMMRLYSPDTHPT